MADEHPCDYYAELNVNRYASAAQIKIAFRKLAKQHHPDKSGNDDTSAFRRIREAYEQLSDTESRAKYDLRFQQSQPHFSPDQTYQPPRRQYNPTAEVKSNSTRTAAYEAERGEHDVEEQNWKSANEYTAECERRFTGRNNAQPVFQGSKSHGLVVQMSSHPAAKQMCTYRTQLWNLNKSGVDMCVFCLKLGNNGSRCPACEVLACAGCFQTITALETTLSDESMSNSKYHFFKG